MVHLSPTPVLGLFTRSSSCCLSTVLSQNTILLLKLGLVLVQNLYLLCQVNILCEEFLVGSNVFLILTF